MKKPSLWERLRAKKQARSTLVGVAWYTEENWRAVKEAATDPERFEATYVEWTAMASEAVSDLRKAGVNAVQFFVVANELLAWCQAQNKPNNAEARAEFVSEKLRTQGLPNG